MPDLQAPLPSQDAAYRLVRGQANGLRDTVSCTLGRAALLSVGLAACGVRGRSLVQQSLAGAVAVEVFVLAWSWAHRNEGAA